MKKLLTTILVFILSITIAIPTKIYGANTEETSKLSSSNLKMDERKLWIDHVSWTRSFIISDLASLPDRDVVLQRLFKNQDDIGNSIKPYYGDEAGKKLSELLRTHISIGGQVVESAKSDNKANLDKYNKSWYKNADEIAEFLSNANPNWSNSEIKNVLHKHLDFVTKQVIARLSKDWNADIEAYDKGEDHMVMFADMLSEGIVKQFPEKFS